MASTRICLQWTIIAFNALSVILGILGIVAGVFEYLKFEGGPSPNIEKIVQLAAASLLVISAFVGCFGAANGHIKVLSSFLLILLVLIASHSWKVWRYDEAKMADAVENFMVNAWLQHLGIRNDMNVIQERYECCGKVSFNDYPNNSLPPSCYYLQNINLRPYSLGCTTAVHRVYLEIYQYEKLAHWSLIGFEAFGALLTIALIWKLVSKTRRYNY